MSISPDLVLKIFERLFGAHPDAKELREALLKYTDKESPRVHLAILKLSEGDTDKLKSYIKAAKADYRDVLAWAEYPEQMRSGKTRFNTPLEEYEAIVRVDRTQYEAWLDEYHDLDPSD
jgi:hypothetical protein